MDLDATVFEFVEAGLLKDAATAVDNSRHEISSTLRVIRNQLEFHVGSPDKARVNAERLLKTRLTDAERALCCETIGRVAFSVGDIEEGQKAFKVAMRCCRIRERLKARSATARWLR